MNLRSIKLSSSTILILVCLTGIILSLSIFQIIDYDIWFEIRSGKLILTNRSLDFNEEFAYTSHGAPYINQEWLSEVIFYVVYHFLEEEGIILFTVFLIFILFGLLFYWMRKEGIDPYVIFGVLLSTYLLCRFRFVLRPHLFSFIFIVLTLFLLHEYNKGRWRSLYILWPMFTLWTNLHFGSLFGLIFVGIYAVGIFLMGERAKSKHLALILLGCLIAVSINPAGFRYFTFPFEVADLARSFGITETVSPLLIRHTLLGYPLFWISLVVTVLLLAKNYKRLNFIEIGLSLFACFLALRMVRFIPKYAVILAPIMARQIHLMAGARLEKIPVRTKNATVVIMSLIVVGVLLSSDVGLLKRYTPGFGVHDAFFPKGAIAFMREHKIKGNVFNDMSYGGYLIFKRFPHNKVFIYGRYTALGKSVFEEYFTVLADPDKALPILNKYNVEVILLDKNLALKAPLMLSLSTSTDWKLVHLDERSMLWVKNVPRFADLIYTYEYDWKLNPS